MRLEVGLECRWPGIWGEKPPFNRRLVILVLVCAVSCCTPPTISCILVEFDMYKYIWPSLPILTTVAWSHRYNDGMIYMVCMAVDYGA